jgi:DNA-binding transcriptional ArsR family regulator
VVKASERLNNTFAALADPTRRGILMKLADGERSVGELAAPFDMSLPAISKHLSVLQRAGLITREREGRIRRCNLDREPLADALGYIRRVGSSG